MEHESKEEKERITRNIGKYFPIVFCIVLIVIAIAGFTGNSILLVIFRALAIITFIAWLIFKFKTDPNFPYPSEK